MRHLLHRLAAGDDGLIYHLITIYGRVTLFAGWPQRNVQVILRRHPCAGDVIFGFDVDSCQFAYDGDRVLATPSALRAYRSVRSCAYVRCGHVH